MSLRILVCGGRMYMDRARISEVLGNLHKERGIEAIIHGGASGVDLLSEAWAGQNGLRAVGFKADWGREGRKAGPKSKQRMFLEGHPDMVVAFPGGSGTADLVRYAKSEGLEVLQVD